MSRFPILSVAVFFDRYAIEEDIWVGYKRTIYNTLCEQSGLAPMEYIALFESMGMKLLPSFDEKAFCYECSNIISPFTDIIVALKADNYDMVLSILEKRHIINMEIYREMKIDVPPYSCYFIGS